MADYWPEPARSNLAPGQQPQAATSTPQCVECGKSETDSCSPHAPRDYLKQARKAVKVPLPLTLANEAEVYLNALERNLGSGHRARPYLACPAPAPVVG